MRRIAPAAFASSHGTLALAVLLCAATALAQADGKPGKANPAAPAFHHVDTDQSGHVTLDEVLAYAKKKNAEATAFHVREVDQDKDGVLTQEELAKAGVKGFEGHGPISVRDLDMSGDGYVSREDLDEYFARKHRAAYARADADKDGAIRPAEFALFRF